MTTSLQRTSLGELGYSPLTATSLGELGAILVFRGSGIGDSVGRKNHDNEDLQIIMMMVSVIEQERD